MIPLVIPRCLRGNLDRHLSFFKLKLSKCFTLLDSMFSIRSSFRSLVNSVLIIFFGVSSMTIVVLLTYLGLALSLVDVALASILMHVVSIRSLFEPVFWVPEKSTCVWLIFTFKIPRIYAKLYDFLFTSSKSKICLNILWSFFGWIFAHFRRFHSWFSRWLYNKRNVNFMVNLQGSIRYIWKNVCYSVKLETSR